MKKLMWKLKTVMEGFKEDQQGIGVIEVVLILVDIFTENTGCFYVYIE
ncbi:MAG: hypothetical protein J6Y20_10560 [Lachnospiraceae bacterium]|nr:hypothetical protein [Lachnospiraceae bacterium]